MKLEDMTKKELIRLARLRLYTKEDLLRVRHEELSEKVLAALDQYTTFVQTGQYIKAQAAWKYYEALDARLKVAYDRRMALYDN